MHSYSDWVSSSQWRNLVRMNRVKSFQRLNIFESITESDGLSSMSVWCTEPWLSFFSHLDSLKSENVNKKKHVFYKVRFHTNKRSCQIDFLFSVTRAHAKKLGALNLFIQILARRSFLFIIGEKRALFIFQFEKLTWHQRMCFKQITHMF